MKTVLVLNGDEMGRGDGELGKKILGTCLRKLPAFSGLEAVVMYNGGVRLATKQSPVAVELDTLRDQGVDLLACGTCVEHFGLGDDMMVDHVSSMDEILATLQRADKVITL